MADEFRHADVGTGLSRAEWEWASSHIANNQVADDMLYYNGTFWVRGTPAQIATVIGLSAKAVAAVEAAGLTLAATKKIVYANDGVIQLGVLGGAAEVKGGLVSAPSAAIIQPKDGNTIGKLFILPKGAQTTAYVSVFDAADPDNAGYGQFAVTGGVVTIQAAKDGTGTAPTLLAIKLDTIPHTSVGYGLGNATHWWKHVNAQYHKIASGGADHFWSGIVSSAITAGENLVFGDAVYMKADGKAWKADADGAATMPIFAIAVATINADASGEVLSQGWIRDDSYNLTAGGIVYASVTAGGVHNAKPIGAGDQIQYIGVAKTTATFYFNPSFNLETV